MHGRKLENLSYIKKTEIKEWFGNRKYAHFPKGLYGHCSYRDGAISFGWEKRPNDFVVSIEDDRISKEEYQQLKAFAKRHHKSLYIEFHTHDRGGGIFAIFSFFLQGVGEEFIKDLARVAYRKLKNWVLTLNCNIPSENHAMIELNPNGDDDFGNAIYLQTDNKGQAILFADELGKMLKTKPLYYDRHGNKIYATETNHIIDELV